MTTNLGFVSPEAVEEEDKFMNGADDEIISIIRTLLSICSCRDNGADNSYSSCPARDNPRIVVFGLSSCNTLKNSS
jgi:hypothetical protein